MTLTERLTELVRAAFSGLWIQSHEHDDCIAEIATLCRDQGWPLTTWDIDRGLAVVGANGTESPPASAADPLAAIRAAGAMSSTEGASLLVLRNLHRFLNSIEIVQALDSAIAAGKQTRTIVIILAPVREPAARTGTPVRGDRPRPAGPGATGGDCTRHGRRARRTARGARAFGRARRRRRPDPTGGRKCLRALTRAPWPARAPGALGTEGPDPPQERPAHAPQGRRAVRRTGRAGRAQAVLHPRSPSRSTRRT